MNGWSEDRDMARYEDFGPKPEDDDALTIHEALTVVEREVAVMHGTVDRIEATLTLLHRVLKQELQGS